MKATWSMTASPPRALVAGLALTALLAGCTGNPGRTRDGRPEPGALESEALRPIATDDCPAPEELLTPAQERSAPGERLPDLTLPCIGSDRTVSLRALGGTPTVVNLWASWCLPCLKEMPAFQEVYAAGGGRVRFLGVNVADRGDNTARKTIQDTGIAYPSVRSEGRRMFQLLQVPGPPLTLFVDAEGTLVHRAVGEMTAAELRAAIAEHLDVVLPASG